MASKEAEIRVLRAEWQGLRNASSTWRSHWGEIRDYMLPYHGEGLSNDTRGTRGGKNTSKIISNIAGFAIRTLASGLHGGLTSPARPWLRLGFENRELEESEDHRRYLFELAEVILGICARSNVYSALHALYQEIPGFGTGALFIDDDDEQYAFAQTLTVGEYELAAGKNNKIDTLWRKLWMSSRQMVDAFGEDRVSQNVLNAYRRSDETTLFPVLHVTRPRQSWGNDSPLPEMFAYESFYFEETGTVTKFLREEIGRAHV